MHSISQKLHDAVLSAVRGMTAEDLARHPEGKWNTAEILEHLYLSYTGTIKGFERCLHEGKPLARPVTFKDRVKTAVVIRAGYLPNGRTAPKNTTPRGMAPEQVAAEIGPKIAAMDAIIAQCEARFGKTQRVLDHPILGPLTTSQWRRFHWLHGRHHVMQILERRAKE
jgi:hypothetical protein